MDSPVAAALSKAKPEVEVEDDKEGEEPSLADVLSSITEILAKLTERKKGPKIESLLGA